MVYYLKSVPFSSLGWFRLGLGSLFIHVVLNEVILRSILVLSFWRCWIHMVPCVYCLMQRIWTTIIRPSAYLWATDYFILLSVPFSSLGWFRLGLGSLFIHVVLNEVILRSILVLSFWRCWIHMVPCVYCLMQRIWTTIIRPSAYLWATDYFILLSGKRPLGKHRKYCPPGTVLENKRCTHEVCKQGGQCIAVSCGYDTYM